MRASVAPIEAALSAGWPEADTLHLLDDSLPRDLASAGGVVNEAIATRFVDLASYATSAGARGILFTCSAFVPAIDAARAVVHVPVFSPHEAMVARVASEAKVVALVATFPPTLPALHEEILSAAAGRGRRIEIVPVLVEEALAALQRSDEAAHDVAIADAVARAVAATPSIDVVALAQFSMASARSGVEQRLAVVDEQLGRRRRTRHLFTTPGAAVEALRRRLVP